MSISGFFGDFIKETLPPWYNLIIFGMPLWMEMPFWRGTKGANFIRKCYLKLFQSTAICQDEVWKDTESISEA